MAENRNKARKPLITAIVYDKKGRVLSVGQNSYVKTHPIQAAAAQRVGEPHRIFLHAEVSALIKADWAKAHSIFVARYSAEGHPAKAAPCKACMEVIKRAGIKEVRHT